MPNMSLARHDERGAGDGLERNGERGQEKRLPAETTFNQPAPTHRLDEGLHELTLPYRECP